MNSRRITGILISGALLGLAGSVGFGLAGDVARFWANWLVWLLFILTIALGSLFIAGLEHVIGAKWSVPIRRVPGKTFQPASIDDSRFIGGSFFAPASVSLDKP